MDPAGTPSPNARYVLVDGPPEIRRLSKQYFWMKHLFNHSSEVLPAAIDLSRVHKVLDAAAGTAAWTLDLADDPAVRARADTSPLELYASDITLSKFPPEEILERAGVRALAHDLTQPFPDAMRGTFDLVHMTYLVYALTEDAWKLALKNVYDVLKPGGYLVLQESDPVIYKPVEDPPPEDGTPHDLETCMEGSSVVRRMNAIFTGLALKSGFVVGLSYKLAPLLAAASFTVLSRERKLASSGRLCVQHLPDFEQISVENLSEVFDVLTRVLLARGALAQVSSEEERSALMDRICGEVKEGVVVVASEWVAQKGGVRINSER